MNNDVGHILHDHKTLKYYQRNSYLTAHQGVAVGQDHGVEEPVREILMFCQDFDDIIMITILIMTMAGEGGGWKYKPKNMRTDGFTKKR